MPLTPAQWDKTIMAGQGHLLQSWAWGQLKSQFGWTALRLHVNGAAAQILFRRLPLGLTIAYIPKGPLVDWTNSQQVQAIFSAIHTEAKKRRAIFLKIEPDIFRESDLSKNHDSGSANGKTGLVTRPKSPQARLSTAAIDFLSRSGFIPADTIQPAASLAIDISRDETTILAAMKQKTRYNIRLAERKGVTVRQGNADDVATFHHLALTTATRSDFGVHSLRYYQTAYDLFSPDRCTLLIAEFEAEALEAEALAALMAFCQGQEAYYFYGASSNKHRNLMSTYLIQWAAIRWAKSRGCTGYDLWGIPEADPATLEAEFQHRRDGLWGVYRFKRGFGGQRVQSIGAYDYVYNPLLYRLYKLRRRW